MRKFIIALVTLSFISIAFAEDGILSNENGVVIDFEATNYGGKVTLKFLKETGVLDIPYWTKTISCTHGEDGQVAHVTYSRSYVLANCKPGHQCQRAPSVNKTRTFKIKFSSLCETGKPSKVFVNGTEVL